MTMKLLAYHQRHAYHRLSTTAVYQVKKCSESLQLSAKKDRVIPIESTIVCDPEKNAGKF